MRYFTNSPFERLMMQVPREQPSIPAAPPRNHPCYGCKRYGESCALPCYRGVRQQSKEPNQRMSGPVKAGPLAV